MEQHELHMIVQFESEPGWKAANNVALSIGEQLMKRDEVIDVEGSVDPEVTENRVKVHKVYED
jgi:hypothetical protein